MTRQATPEQLAALVVPAILPGVVRRGTPVWAWDEDTPWTVLAVEDDGAMCAPCAGLGLAALIDVGNLQVDLTDATGRAHLAWTLTNAHGVSFHLDADGFRRWSLHGGEQPRSAEDWAWEGIGPEARRMRIGNNISTYGYDAIDLPALDSLNPDDDTRLPDGSRWVDAEALRRVAMHVLGGGA